MAGNDLVQRFLANETGSGLAQQADPNGGNKFGNQLIDSYAQAGEVMPADVQVAVRELNEMTDRESELAGANAGTRAYLSGAGYDALASKRRANELTSFLYEKSAHARNLQQKLENDKATANVRAIEIQNEFNTRTMDDNVAMVGLSRRAQEVEVAKGEMENQNVVQQRGMLDFVNKNSIDLPTMRKALEDGSSNALAAAFGEGANRLGALSVYNLMSKAENGFVQQQLDTAAKTVEAEKSKFIQENFTKEQAMQMLAGDIPIPEGYSRTAVAAARDELASTSENMAMLQAMQVQGIQNQQQLETTYLGALNTPQLNSLVSQLSALPADPRNPMIDKDGFVQLGMPDGSAVKISATSIMDEYAKRGQLSMQKNATMLMDNHAFDVFAKGAQETQRQVQLAVSMSGVTLSPTLQNQIAQGQSQAAQLFQASLREQDPARRAKMQDTANTIINSSMQLVTEQMQKQGVPQYLIDDLQNGKLMSETSFRQALGSAIGFGQGASRSPLAGAIDTAITSMASGGGWFSSGLSQEGIRDMMTPGKDGTYKPIEDSGIDIAKLDQAVMQSIVQVQATTVMSAFRSNPDLISVLPVDMQERIADITNPNSKVFANSPPAERVGRLLDILQIADTKAQNLQAAGLLSQEYRPGQFVKTAQAIMQDQSVLTKWLAGPNGVPDRETAAVLALVLERRRGIPKAGKDALAYDQLVPAMAQESATALWGSMTGRVYDKPKFGNPDAIMNDTHTAYSKLNLEMGGGFNDGFFGTGPVTWKNASPLLTAATANLYIKRLASENEPSVLSPGSWASGLKLDDSWNYIASAEEILEEAASLAGTSRDKLGAVFTAKQPQQ